MIHDPVRDFMTRYHRGIRLSCKFHCIANMIAMAMRNEDVICFYFFDVNAFCQRITRYK